MKNLKRIQLQQNGLRLAWTSRSANDQDDCPKEASQSPPADWFEWLRSIWAQVNLSLSKILFKVNGDKITYLAKQVHVWLELQRKPIPRQRGLNVLVTSIQNVLRKSAWIVCVCRGHVCLLRSNSPAAFDSTQNSTLIPKVRNFGTWSFGKWRASLQNGFLSWT